MACLDNPSSSRSSDEQGRDQNLVDSQGVRPVQAELTSVAWVAHGELGYDEWLRHGGRLGVASRSAGWWIGDWIRYGSTHYGSKYAMAARVTGYDDQTLMNMVYVATRFEVSRRREKLSWSHHAEVAALDRDGQERWLDRAAAARLTVRGLRRELWSARQHVAPHLRAQPESTTGDASLAPSARPGGVRRGQRIASAPGVDVEAENVVTCPHCNQQFVVVPSTRRGGSGSRAPDDEGCGV